MRIVVIGGGSSYTPELVEGFINYRKTLPLKELWLVDVEAGEEKVAINTALVKRMFEKAKMDVKVTMTLDRKEALKNADYVLTQLRVGGLRARALDESLPLKYKMIGQETTGVGGMTKGLRTLPVIQSICDDIEALCPDAWLINFTNPSGMVTEYIAKHTRVKSIGLCNVPINMAYEVAETMKVPYEALDCRFAGLNHLSFMTHAYYEGHDLLPAFLAKQDQGQLVKNITKIEAMDQVAHTIGYMLSPYMQYFFFEKEMLEEELDKVAKGEGTRAEQVMAVEAKLFELYKNPDLKDKPEELKGRGGARYSEAAIKLVNSLHNNLGDIQVVNVVNGGAIASLPEDGAIETHCVITKNGPRPFAGISLSPVVEGLVQQVKNYEALTIEGVLKKDKNIVYQAMLANPLVHSAIDAKALLDELIEAHHPWLDYLRSEDPCM